jgi:hypothetical protein
MREMRSLYKKVQSNAKSFARKEGYEGNNDKVKDSFVDQVEQVWTRSPSLPRFSNQF